MALLVTLTDGTTSLNLMDKTKHAVRHPGPSAPPPAAGARVREITLPMQFYGATADAAWDNYANVEAMLTRARRVAGAFPQGANVVLSVTPETTNAVSFDVVDGWISAAVPHPADGWIDATLSLVCLPFGRGDAVTEVATATLTNGTGSTWLVTGITGDVPALARLTVEDVSTGSAVINGVHVYGRSHHDLTAGHFDPAVEMTAVAPGVATTDSSSYSGSDFARLSANGTWRTIAEVTRPTGDFNNGLYDLWLRVRDSSAVPSVPRNLTAEVTPGVVVTPVAQGTATASTTVAGTTLTALTPDHLLVLIVRANSRTATISSITSIGGASWTLATDGVDDARVVHGTEDIQVNIYHLRPVSNIAVGTTVTVTFSGSVTSQLSVYSLTEMATASVVDQVAVDATVTNNTTIATNSVTTTQDFTVLIAALVNLLNTDYGAMTNSFASLTSGIDGQVWGRRIVTATGTYSTGATATNAANDHVGTLVAFKAASATAPSLTAGTWHLCVVAVGADGSLSPVTGILQVTISNTTSTIVLDWDAPASGSVSSYRAYRNRGSGWGYFDTGSTDTDYTWTTESGITAGDPDIDGSPIGLFRVQVALTSGTVLFTGETFSAPVTASMWCDALAGTFPFPPIPALDGDDPPGWLVRVQGRHDDAFPDLDVDLAWLVPHDDPQLLAEYSGLDLATSRDIVLDQRRDGRVSGRLYESGTTTDAGQLDTIGGLYVGPGATQIALRLTGADGVSDVDDLKCVVTLRYVPRFRLFRGT